MECVLVTLLQAVSYLPAICINLISPYLSLSQMQGFEFGCFLTLLV